MAFLKQTDHKPNHKANIVESAAENMFDKFTMTPLQKAYS